MNAENVIYLENGECKELGTETEAEKQLKKLLEKQLDTKITLQQQFEQHRTFTPSGSYVPINETVSGIHSINEFVRLEEDDFRIQELQKCGLTNEEINIYLSCNGLQLPKKVKLAVNPDILSQKLDGIMQKIQERQTILNRPTSFAGTRQLNRHEMDIEKTLYSGCQNKEQLKSLITINGNKCTSLDGPYKHISELSKKIECYIRSKRKKEKFNAMSELTQNSKDDIQKPQDNSLKNKPDASVLHAVVLLDEKIIKENRLSCEEIRKIPRFQNYVPGKPNKVLYLKNLHSKVDIRELVSLFDGFVDDRGEPPKYRLLTGRMRGQAFVTFSDDTIAQKALELINGYKLRGQPIVIEFGKNVQ